MWIPPRGRGIDPKVMERAIAFVTIGTEGSSSLGLDQGLEPLAHQFRNQLPGSAAAKQLRQLMGGRIRDGHGLVLRWW